MQLISNVDAVTLKFNVFILLWIFLLIPELSFGEMSNDSGVYFEMIGGLSRNMATKTSKIYSNDNPRFNYKSDKNTIKPNVYVGTGYQWQINDDWSWGTGGRLGYNTFDARGNGELLGSNIKPFKYKFTISALSAAIVNRLIYTEEYWQYYGALSAGLSKLKSDNYQDYSGSHKNTIKNYRDKTVNNPFYSISLGIIRRLYENFSLGIDIGFINFKEATLGQSMNTKTTGSVKQKLNVMNVDVSFIYQF